ncbi:MAG: xanthine phosphoribosyltransferase [Evtepia gabavorous]
MEALKQRIQRDGKIRGNNEVLKVDSFLNHQMDVAFLEEIGREFRRRFAGCQVDRILTIEASGIGIACLAAPAVLTTCQWFSPRRTRPKTSTGTCISARWSPSPRASVPIPFSSPRSFCTPEGQSLLIDDFLAQRQRPERLIDLVHQAGPEW